VLLPQVLSKRYAVGARLEISSGERSFRGVDRCRRWTAGASSEDGRRVHRMRETSREAAAASTAERGSVSSQAQTMRPATPHFTAERRGVEPTPMIAPVIVWVVDTGMPASVAPIRVTAPAVSAQKPPIGCSLVILVPIVLTMRQPPKSVPRAIAAWLSRMTQIGTAKLFRYPEATSRPVMIPIVFWASLPPCPRL